MAGINCTQEYYTAHDIIPSRCLAIFEMTLLKSTCKAAERVTTLAISSLADPYMALILAYARPASTAAREIQATYATIWRRFLRYPRRYIYSLYQKHYRWLRYWWCISQEVPIFLGWHVHSLQKNCSEGLCYWRSISSMAVKLSEGIFLSSCSY